MISKTLIIADLASPRGGQGPINSSLHQSHETGLDVDIWFRSAKKSESARKIKWVSMLNENYDKTNKIYWGREEAKILEYAGSFEEVDRMFVNRVITKEQCRKHLGEDWLGIIIA